MSSTNDGGPAFPFPSGPEPRVNAYHDRSEGMSLRDWFAGQATTDDVNDAKDREAQKRAASKHPNNKAEQYELRVRIRAEISNTKARYLHADAMLAARQEARNGA